MPAAPHTTHLVITDSGLGGLSVCADLERLLGEPSAPAVDARITYVNAWPEQGRGYNDLPDIAARARVFDRVLRRIGEMRPDLLVIACNTLSIVYESTEFRSQAAFPVHGIVDAGVDLFQASLSRMPQSPIVLLGTRTTIASGVHRARLIDRGVPADRIAGAACHGLATSIERGPSSADTLERVETCAAAAAATAPAGDPLYVGLCCTHYGMIAGRIGAAITRHAARRVDVLDPNARLSRDVLARIPTADPAASDRRAAITVVSKVSLTVEQRAAVGGLFERTSPATAQALRHYTHVPELF